LQADESLVWEFENLSETAALASSVFERMRLLPAKKDLPDLVILDGGKPQINAVITSLDLLNIETPPIVGAVKPPKSHNRICHFLTEDNSRIVFNPRSKAMNFIQDLRDRAHQLANETHRELHSLVQIFKNNDSIPRINYLQVPLRFAERSGNAEDLSPIRSLSQSGEIIFKTKNKSREKGN